MVCHVCGRTGCDARKHWTKCSVCGETGHNKSFHASQQSQVKRKRTANHFEDSNLNMEFQPQVGSVAEYQAPLQLDPQPQSSEPSAQSESLQRRSKVAISQPEIDMAARVLLACQEEKIKGPIDLGRPVERAARMTGLGTTTMQRIKNVLSEENWPEAIEDTRGSWSRLQDYGQFDHNQLLTKIHNHIAKLHKMGSFPTLEMIRTKLSFHDGIRISRRLLSSILHEVGYSYKQPAAGNIMFVQENQQLSEQRHRYLQSVTAKRAERKIIYVDESYVNKSHNARRCWVRKGSQIYVPSGKGPRYIIVGAGSRDGWLLTKIIKNNSASSDYHSAMNGDHFEEIFEEMCKAATEKLGPSIFLLDNAAYHKRLDNEKLLMKYWRSLPASEVKAAWADGTVPGQLPEHGQLSTKVAIISHLRDNMPTGQMKIEMIAASEGHEVLFLPPYRPELNAIETAWGVTKNFVGRNNLPSLPFKDLREVIERGFTQVSVSVWVGLDNKVIRTEQEQLKVLKSEKDRLEKFRDDHPDLMFHVGSGSDSESDSNSDSDSDCGSKAGEEAVIAHLRDGLGGTESPPVVEYNDMEMEAALTLASSFSLQSSVSSSGSVTEE